MSYQGQEQTRSSASAKPPRVLSCLLCQQRKVKCDRKSPCQNCIKAGAQCVSTAPAQRQRRRRFPERELLDRISQYQDLLRKNNIDFEPLHAQAATRDSHLESERKADSPRDSLAGEDFGPNGLSEDGSVAKSGAEFEAKNIWQAMNQRIPDDGDDEDDNYDDDCSDVLPEAIGIVEIKKAWDEYKSSDHLLFCSPRTNIELTALHPDHVQIFRLWQIYLDNINPLLKITHTPTLQARILDAIGDMANINPNLEALMLSIYCVAIHSLKEDDCFLLLKSPKEELLNKYQSGCQQALIKCSFLKSADIDCLTAFYLYLISVRPELDGRSLSSMLGIAIRVAQRIGIHNESANAKCTILEAEMRRRLWWSLVIFDARMSEKSFHKDVTLAPTWNCKAPLNVNDFDLRPEMKVAPAVHTEPTEALFVVVRSELGDFTRFCLSHLDFSNPILIAVAKVFQQGNLSEAERMVNFEKRIEDKYLKYCNPDNPIHFTTIWTSRGYMAKVRLLEHYSRYLRSSAQQSDTQRDEAISHALCMLDCDTRLLSSPLTKPFSWWCADLQFPFPAYLHLAQEMRRRPLEHFADKCWEVLSANYEVRFVNVSKRFETFFKIFSRIILLAWTARESAIKQANSPVEVPPPIISGLRSQYEAWTPSSQNTPSEPLEGAMSMGNVDSDFLMPMMNVDLANDGTFHGYWGRLPVDADATAMDVFTAAGDMQVQNQPGFDVGVLDWNAMNWNTGYKNPM